jgi:molybdopterin synthase sulfur carrier subunit
MMGRIVRVDLPAHLRTLAQVQGEVRVAVLGAVTLRTVVSALEAEYPMLCGTIREYGSGERRAFLRFFAGEEDLSHDGMDLPLPEAVARGDEALLVVGAVAGGFG